MEKPHAPAAPPGRIQIRIATVYRRDRYETFRPLHMGTTRWLRMSQCLANLGHWVDMILDSGEGLVEKDTNLRYVPYAEVNWGHYDVVKTLFHKGFESLCAAGGAGHPFIISKLGSVVGSHDDVKGVGFRGAERSGLYAIQNRISRASRYVTVLTARSRALWEREHGWCSNVLTVPTGVDAAIPPPRSNPYRGIDRKVAVYIGNLYSEQQKPVNLLWQERLNRLGAALNDRGLRLCFAGTGDTERIDPDVVSCYKDIDNSNIWDYQYFADVGIVLGQDAAQHNESSKIYYYLRTGLPVVSESGIPNNRLLEECCMGIVCEFGNDAMMVEAIDEALRRPWPRADCMEYILHNHTWAHRAAVYQRLFDTDPALRTSAGRAVPGCAP